MHMSTKEYLHFLQKEIHSTAVATIGEDGHPQLRIIDMMLADDDSLYFITAKGKAFYRQLLEQQYVAVTGQKDGRAVSLRGRIRRADATLLERVFRENAYMCTIYPGNTRGVLEVFQIYEGQGEYFDLSQRPVFREAFAIGNTTLQDSGYFITKDCIGCKLCGPVCPQKCIDFSVVPAVIQLEHCLHCGKCAEICPKQAVIRR